MLKRFNMHASGEPKRREKRKRAEIIFEGIVAENFPKNGK